MPDLEEIPHKIRRGPRGYAAYRHSMMQRGGLTRSQISSAEQNVSSRAKRRRGRPYSRGRGIARAELLSQHEEVVSQLLEEDVERGLQLKSPSKSIKEKIFPNLREGKFMREYEINTNY